MTERLSRTAVITRAAALSDEIGLAELTITKLGRVLNIAPPGVYRHVTDLTDLRRGISQYACRDLAPLLSTACAGLAGAAALRALATTLRTWAHDHPGQYEALQIAPDSDDTEGQVAARALLDVMGSALRAYDLRDDNLTDAIRLIRSTLHGFIALELHEGFKQSRSVDATFGRIVTALDSVLTEWSPR